MSGSSGTWSSPGGHRTGAFLVLQKKVPYGPGVPPVVSRQLLWLNHKHPDTASVINVSLTGYLAGLQTGDTVMSSD